MQRRIEHRRETDQRSIALHVLAVHPLERIDLARLARERAHDAHAGQVLLHARRDLAEVIGDRFRALMNLRTRSTSPARQQPESPAARAAPSSDRRAAIIVNAPTTISSEENECMTRRTDEHAHIREIVRRARHQIARSLLVVEAQRQLLQMPVEVVAHVELDVPRRADDDAALRVEEDPFHDRRADEHQPVAHQHPARESHAPAHRPRCR